MQGSTGCLDASALVRTIKTMELKGVGTNPSISQHSGEV